MNSADRLNITDWPVIRKLCRSANYASSSRCLQRPNHLAREHFYLLAPGFERSAWPHDEFCCARGDIGLDFART